MRKLCVSVLLITFLSGCTKPPDLEAPCRDFGKHCCQLAINDLPITGDVR